MGKGIKSKIREYMALNVEDHIDPTTGDVNMTTLVEDTCHHLEEAKVEWLDDPDHFVWEIATEYENWIL